MVKLPQGARVFFLKRTLCIFLCTGGYILFFTQKYRDADV